MENIYLDAKGIYYKLYFVQGKYFVLSNNKELTLPDNISDSQSLVVHLMNKIADQQQIIYTLQVEIDQLKARLHMDSHNSSKPPSSDGLHKKPAFPRKKGGNAGGQAGHQGHTLEMVQSPDHIILCKAEQCTCGQDLSLEQVSVQAHRQVFDLPEPRLETTQYQVGQIICPSCGRLHKTEFPQGVNAPAQYGPRVRALITMLNSDYKMPFKKIQALFEDLYGYPVNVSTVTGANATLYDQLAGAETIIKDQLIASDVVSSDESGIRCQGKLHWLHVASNPLFTYLFVHPKRGSQAIESEQSILNRFLGFLVHDCWHSYFNLTHVKHAICGAHLLRELQCLAENQSRWAACFKQFLMETYHQPFEQRLQTRQAIEQKYDTLIHQAYLEEPPPVKTKGKRRRTQGRNLLERLEKFKDPVLAFAFNEPVPFTNNQAERDIRPAKVKQKISGCLRTTKGANHYARIAGFISTARKHQLNVFKELSNAFEGHTFLSVNMTS